MTSPFKKHTLHNEVALPKLTEQTGGTNSQQNKEMSAAFSLPKVCVKHTGEREGKVLLQGTQKCKTWDTWFCVKTYISLLN